MRCLERNSNAWDSNTIAGGTSSLAADNEGSNLHFATSAPTTTRARTSPASRPSILITNGDAVVRPPREDSGNVPGAGKWTNSDQLVGAVPTHRPMVRGDVRVDACKSRPCSQPDLFSPGACAL